MSAEQEEAWIIPTDAVRAIGLFSPDGPVGYRAQPPWAPVDAPLYPSRAEAMATIHLARNGAIPPTLGGAK